MKRKEWPQLEHTALSLRKKKVAQRTSSKALEEFLLPVQYGVVRQQYNGICSTNFQGYGYVPLCGILPSARRKLEPGTAADYHHGFEHESHLMLQ